MKKANTVTPVNRWRIASITTWLLTACACNYYGSAGFDNTPPVIGVTGNVQILANSRNNEIFISVSDNRTRRSRLIVTVSSSNTLVVANQNISVSGDNRSIFISPRTNVIGSTIITITATDRNGNTATRFFTVNVVGFRLDTSSLVRDVFSGDENNEPMDISPVELMQETKETATFDDLIDKPL